MTKVRVSGQALYHRATVLPIYILSNVCRNEVFCMLSSVKCEGEEVGYMLSLSQMAGECNVQDKIC